jgi:hypothetical protein
MKIPLVVISLILTLFVSLRAQNSPPLLGAWRLDDGRTMKFKEDKTCAIWTKDGNFIHGKWEEDPFTEAIKRYAVAWKNDQVYDVEVAPGGSALRGTRKVQGDRNTATRVDELKVFMWGNDIATLWVNGIHVLSAGLKNVKEGRIFVKSGDVITINLANKTGVMQLGFEAFNGVDKVLSAGELYYTEVPEIDWQTTPRMAMGYRRPLAQMKRNFVIGPVKDPMIASPQKRDEKYKKLHFKYVVK